MTLPLSKSSPYLVTEILSSLFCVIISMFFGSLYLAVIASMSLLDLGCFGKKGLNPSSL